MHLENYISSLTSMVLLLAVMVYLVRKNRKSTNTHEQQIVALLEEIRDRLPPPAGSQPNA
jgi:preprotein translocase subunit YajC